MAIVNRILIQQPRNSKFVQRRKNTLRALKILLFLRLKSSLVPQMEFLFLCLGRDVSSGMKTRKKVETICTHHCSCIHFSKWLSCQLQEKNLLINRNSLQGPGSPQQNGVLINSLVSVRLKPCPHLRGVSERRF